MINKNGTKEIGQPLVSPVDVSSNPRVGRGEPCTPPRVLVAPTEISSVRERVRRMQGMNQTDIAQGIQAMEAVAAAACRTPCLKTGISGEPNMDISRRRPTRSRSDSITREQSGTDRRGTGRGITPALAEASKKWSNFPTNHDTTSRPSSTSPRPMLRLPSGDTIPMRSNFSASPPHYPDSYVAKAADMSSSSSSNASRENDAMDTLPKSGSVRAAAQALGAAQVPGALSRGSPARFRSITSKGSPSSLGDQSFATAERRTGTLRRNGRGWWTRTDKEMKPTAIGVRGENAELRAENAELRAEGRRLEEAAREAEGKIAAVKQEAEAVAKQATLQVRRADDRRAKAEDAMRDAESKASSLTATMQFLKSTSDFATVIADGKKGSASEVEVTAAYQGILQEMDIERAALQQKLAAALRENDMLRIQVLRLKPSSPLRNGDGIKSNSRNEAEREPSPLPRQRSFLRPRARGYSSGKLVEGVSPSGTPRRSDATTTDDSSETGERLSGSRLKGSVSEGVLGQRVRMLQLMGIESLVGDGDVSSGGFSPKRWSKSRTEDLTTRSKSCSNLQNGQAPASWGSGSNVPWCQEWARWCGRVSLVVTPGTGSRSRVPYSPVHSALLTDAAFYIMEARTGRRGEPGCESLCRLEQHRVESLSLPFETRVLPNGDEVAVRSKALVLRLRFEEELPESRERQLSGFRMGSSVQLRVDSLDDMNPSTPENRGRKHWNERGRGKKGHLWLSCDTNEARGELVERLCQWHRLKPRSALGQQRQSYRHATGDMSAGSTESSPVSSDRSSDVMGSPSFVTGARRRGVRDPEEDEGLEVEQILLNELLEEIADEQSVSVSALISVDEGSPKQSLIESS